MRGWGLWRWLDHEDSALMSGINVFMKGTPGAPQPLPQVRLQQKDGCLREAGSHQTQTLPVPWSWTCQSPELWGMHFCYWEATQSGSQKSDRTERLTLSLHFQSVVFCSSSLSGVKQLIGLITRFFSLIHHRNHLEQFQGSVNNPHCGEKV